MSVQQLNVLVGTAVVDPQFQEALLNGQRREMIAPFELTDEERGVVLSIQAENLQDFAQILHDWLRERETVDAVSSDSCCALA